MVLGFLEVGPNEYGKQPITVTVAASSRDENDMTAWLSPAEARLLAIYLNKLADAASCGRVVSEERSWRRFTPSPDLKCAARFFSASWSGC
jgi:hypothetical protein